MTVAKTGDPLYVPSGLLIPFEWLVVSRCLPAQLRHEIVIDLFGRCSLLQTRCIALKMESHENLAPQVLASLARQLKSIATKPPEGVKYIPSEGNITEIVAEIEGPETTPYEGGIFRVKLVLGKDYPATPPKGYFLTKIFHPNVSPTGDICVNTLKRDWKPDVGLSHVLQVIRCLLIVPFPESSLNDDAGKMFMESYDEYARHARLMTR